MLWVQNNSHGCELRPRWYSGSGPMREGDMNDPTEALKGRREPQPALVRNVRTLPAMISVDSDEVAQCSDMMPPGPVPRWRVICATWFLAGQSPVSMDGRHRESYPREGVWEASRGTGRNRSTVPGPLGKEAELHTARCSA